MVSPNRKKEKRRESKFCQKKKAINLRELMFCSTFTLGYGIELQVNYYHDDSKTVSARTLLKIPTSI